MILCHVQAKGRRKFLGSFLCPSSPVDVLQRSVIWPALLPLLYYPYVWSHIEISVMHSQWIHEVVWMPWFQLEALHPSSHFINQRGLLEEHTHSHTAPPPPPLLPLHALCWRWEQGHRISLITHLPSPLWCVIIMYHHCYLSWDSRLSSQLC